LLNAITVCTDLLGDRVAGLKNSLRDLELSREAGMRLNEAVALSNVGMSYLEFGVFEEARRHLQEALRLNGELGNRQVEGNTHAMLSELEWRDGNPALALRHAHAAYGISVEVDSRLHQMDSLWSVGNAELAMAHWDAAGEAFERSEVLARELGMVPHVLNGLDGRIRTALAQGDKASAMQLADRLLAEAAGAGAAHDAAPTADATKDRDAALPPFTGSYEHLVRLTLYRVYADVDRTRARRLLRDSHEALKEESDRIDDVALKHGFLDRIAEHREILALWARSKEAGARAPSA
jgi:tetratricopeptide (TPR) repeat protein